MLHRKNCYAQRLFHATQFSMDWSKSLLPVLVVDSMLSNRRFRVGKDFELWSMTNDQYKITYFHLVSLVSTRVNLSVQKVSFGFWLEWNLRAFFFMFNNSIIIQNLLFCMARVNTYLLLTSELSVFGSLILAGSMTSHREPLTVRQGKINSEIIKWRPTGCIHIVKNHFSIV